VARQDPIKPDRTVGGASDSTTTQLTRDDPAPGPAAAAF